jgi:hypothetical protein
MTHGRVLGLRIVAIGLALVIAPLFAPGPQLAAALRSLEPAGWILVALGGALLWRHRGAPRRRMG